MTNPRASALASLLVLLAHTAVAQVPPRPTDTPRAVTLSLAEYNRLIDLANRPAPRPTLAPVAAVLASADLRVRVERESARGTFSVNGEVLRPGTSKVTLLSGATLVDATAGGRPLPLVADGSAHTALIPGPGPFSLTLEWGAPLAFAPGRASFVLPVPQAGTARTTIDLPGEQADVRLSAGLITRRSVAGGRTIVEATLDPGSATEVWWSMRDSAPAAATREVRTLADVMTLVTLGDSDVRMAALIDITVVQGELRTVGVRLPSGYELTGISGSSLETSAVREDGVVLTVGDPAARSHQFLISLERAHAGGSFALDTGFVTLRDVQRERGEVAIEGVGTLDLTATERDGLRRIDVRELSGALHSLSRLPILSAFRYQRATAVAPGLALDVKRFADAGVLAAVADRAVATTLVTSEGRALTEVTLTVRNRAQSFLRVTLPKDASISSVEIAGQPAKPANGVDGTRVPLLRPGLTPGRPYQVSFVYLHAGTPFARKGDYEMSLPKMDMPVGIVEWEVFVPERYSVRAIGGNVIDQRAAGARGGVAGGAGSGFYGIDRTNMRPHLEGGRVHLDLEGDALPGQIRGRVTDASGSVLPGVTIALTTRTGQMSTMTDANGRFLASGVPAGQVSVTAYLEGFRTETSTFAYDERPRQMSLVLQLGSLSETVSVVGESPRVDYSRADAPKMDRDIVQPSQNVINLQRRAQGVLPVRVDVPRAGTSHQFVKPLVVDQETIVKLRYKQR